MAGFLLLAAPLFACSFSPSDQALYRQAQSSNNPVPVRRAAFETLVQVCPSDAVLAGQFASFLVAGRDFAKALAASDRGLVADPSNPLLRLRKGEALIGLNQPAAALKVLDPLPPSGESQFFIGLADQLLNDHYAAQAALSDAWRRGNQDPYVLYALMKEDKALNDKAQGVEHFKTMLARFPDSAWIHILLGDAHFEAGRFAAAKEEYLAANNIMPDLFEPNFRLAYLAFEADDNASAIEYYRHALLAEPHHTEANVYLGEALRRNSQYGQAILQLRHAIEIDPTATLAYDSLAKSYADTGKFADASTVLADAESKFPDNSAFPAMRARMLTRLGQPQAAAAESQRAQAIIAEKNRKQALVQP